MTALDLNSPRFKAAPYESLKALQDRGGLADYKIPVMGKMKMAVSYEAASAMLKDRQAFVSEPRNAGRPNSALVPNWMPRTIKDMADNMLVRDEPDHRRLRYLVDLAFQRRAIEDMRSRIRQLAEQRLDALGTDAELVEDYAKLLPMDMICELLGLPTKLRPEFIKAIKPIANIASVFGIMGVFSAMAKIRSI